MGVSFLSLLGASGSGLGERGWWLGTDDGLTPPTLRSHRTNDFGRFIVRVLSPNSSEFGDGFNFIQVLIRSPDHQTDFWSLVSTSLIGKCSDANIAFEPVGVEEIEFPAFAEFSAAAAGVTRTVSCVDGGSRQ